LTKFKYRFATIKGVKQKFEKKAQRELAVIDLEINKKQQRIMQLKEIIKQNKENKIAEKHKKTDELHFYEKYECYLNEQLKICQDFIIKKAKQRENKLKELVKKSQETKTFEKLEEKHLADFLKDQDKLDQKEMDEFAVNEFSRD
jgi:flagellar FliJ protein